MKPAFLEKEGEGAGEDIYLLRNAILLGHHRGEGCFRGDREQSKMFSNSPPCLCKIEPCISLGLLRSAVVCFAVPLYCAFCGSRADAVRQQPPLCLCRRRPRIGHVTSVRALCVVRPRAAVPISVCGDSEDRANSTSAGRPCKAPSPTSGRRRWTCSSRS